MIVYRHKDEPIEVNLGDRLAYVHYDALVTILDEETKTGTAREIIYEGWPNPYIADFGEPYEVDERDLWYGRKSATLNKPCVDANHYCFIAYRDPPDES